MNHSTDAHDALRKMMDFDHVIRVHSDARVTDDSGEYAPELMADVDADGQMTTTDADMREEVSRQGWTLVSGFTGQHGYNGPLMHPSEYIGGGLADYILDTPGLWVALTVECTRPDGEREEMPAGWVLAHREEEV